LIAIGAGAIVVALIAIAVWVYASHWRPDPARYPIQGIDVSEEQGAIDWNTVAAHGADFAYIRATAGAGQRDNRFGDNWRAAAAAGMRRGAFHAWSFCAGGVAQADNFVTTVPRVSDALPATLVIAFAPDCDARPTRAALVAQLVRFLSIAETHTGEPMLLKISKPVARAYQLGTILHRPLWEVRNFAAPNYAARPWRMWQASDMRRIDGIDGPVHWDVVAP
jgi:lysozyme